MSEFKPGLEGVVAFETEIAEPDRDGGALRYRGVDIEELVGTVPFEKVWGLLVDDEPEPGPPRRRAVRGPRSHRERSVRSPGGDGTSCRRVGARSADRHHRRGGARRSRATVGDDDLDRGAVGPSRRRVRRSPSTPSSSRAGRRRPSASCSSGAERRTPGMSRRSTRTGSAPPSTGSTRRRSPRASSLRPVPTARRRSHPPSVRSRVRSTAAPPRVSCRCSTEPPRPIRSRST